MGKKVGGRPRQVTVELTRNYCLIIGGQCKEATDNGQDRHPRCARSIGLDQIADSTMITQSDLKERMKRVAPNCERV